MIFDSERAKRVRANAEKGIKPLVSFSVIAYNQEKYVADAVQSAFAQTYSPLEIVLSDDCSSDRTFEIMKELAANYRGPHKIVLNRNERNLGVTAHIRKVSLLRTGDFCTGCAGDDIALPNKAQIMVDRWAQDDYRPIVIFTNGYLMSQEGVRQELIYSSLPRVQSRSEFLRFPATTMPGATAGQSADLVDIYGPLNPTHSSSEDTAGAIRGVLIDHLVYVDSPVHLWRSIGLWSGMGDAKYNKFKYWNGMRNAEGIARQALCDAMMLQDAQAITAMCKYWVESNYRKACVMESFWKLPWRCLIAWQNGGRLTHLLRWFYHAVRYRWLFVVKPFLGLDRTEYAPLVQREVIYNRKLK